MGITTLLKTKLLDDTLVVPLHTFDNEKLNKMLKCNVGPKTNQQKVKEKRYHC